MWGQVEAGHTAEAGGRTDSVKSVPHDQAPETGVPG